MKRAVKIARIVMCAVVSFYMLYLCGHAGRSAYQKCQTVKINADGAYYLAWGGMNREGVLYIAVGVLLLLLGAASIFLLFRPARMAAVGSALCAVAGALLGVSLNTELSEFMFMRYQLGMPNIPVELALSFKPLISRLCIYAAILYVACFLIAFYHQHRKEN